MPELRWGIFDQGGQPVLEADSVFSVEFEKDFSISHYPQERGAFESYNKVELPYHAKVTYLVGLDREGFLAEVGKRLASLDLLTVTTPDFSYASANLMHYGYRRAVQGGVTLLKVEVWCEEVRVVGSGELTNGTTQSTNGAATQDNGTAQPEGTDPSPDGSGFIPGGDTRERNATGSGFTASGDTRERTGSATGGAAQVTAPPRPGDPVFTAPIPPLSPVDGGGTSYVDPNAATINQGVITVPF